MGSPSRALGRSGVGVERTGALDLLRLLRAAGGLLGCLPLALGDLALLLGLLGLGLGRVELALALGGARPRLHAALPRALHGAALGGREHAREQEQDDEHDDDDHDGVHVCGATRLVSPEPPRVALGTWMLRISTLHWPGADAQC